MAAKRQRPSIPEGGSQLSFPGSDDDELHKDFMSRPLSIQRTTTNKKKKRRHQQEKTAPSPFEQLPFSKSSPKKSFSVKMNAEKSPPIPRKKKRTESQKVSSATTSTAKTKQLSKKHDESTRTMIPPRTPPRTNKKHHDPLESSLEIPYALNFGNNAASSRIAKAGTEPLRAGDVIRYDNPIYVAGTKQAIVVTQILAIDPTVTNHDDDDDEDDVFPLDLANGAMIPIDTYISRIKEYRADDGELYPHHGLRRRIKDFRLVAGKLVSQGGTTTTGLQLRMEAFQTIIAQAQKQLEDEMNQQQQPDHESSHSESSNDDDSTSDDSTTNPPTVRKTSMIAERHRKILEGTLLKEESSTEEEEETPPRRLLLSKAKDKTLKASRAFLNKENAKTCNSSGNKRLFVDSSDEEELLKPRHAATKPRQLETKPQHDASKPRQEATKPRKEATKSRHSITKPRKEATKARSDTTKQGKEATKPRCKSKSVLEDSSSDDGSSGPASLLRICTKAQQERRRKSSQSSARSRNSDPSTSVKSSGRHSKSPVNSECKPSSKLVVKDVVKQSKSDRMGSKLRKHSPSEVRDSAPQSKDRPQQKDAAAASPRHHSKGNNTTDDDDDEDDIPPSLFRRKSDATSRASTSSPRNTHGSAAVPSKQNPDSTAKASKLKLDASEKASKRRIKSFLDVSPKEDLIQRKKELSTEEKKLQKEEYDRLLRGHANSDEAPKKPIKVKQSARSCFFPRSVEDTNSCNDFAGKFSSSDDEDDESFFRNKKMARAKNSQSLEDRRGKELNPQSCSKMTKDDDGLGSITTTFTNSQSSMEGRKPSSSNKKGLSTLKRPIRPSHRFQLQLQPIPQDDDSF